IKLLDRAIQLRLEPGSVHLMYNLSAYLRKGNTPKVEENIVNYISRYGLAYRPNNVVVFTKTYQEVYAGRKITLLGSIVTNNAEVIEDDNWKYRYRETSSVTNISSYHLL